MKITLGDKAVSHSLDLTSDEFIRLVRFQKPKPNIKNSDLEIISPVLLLIGEKKIQATVLNMQDDGTAQRRLELRDEMFDELSPRKQSEKQTAKDVTERIAPFRLELEITAETFEALIKTKDVLVLFRVQNIPCYVQTSKVKIDFNLENSPIPALVIKVDKVRPVLELLKVQITESQFNEVYIEGKSDDFYDKGGADLDDLVELIGVKRKIDESDIALRRRVKEYLQLRLEQLSRVKDDDLQQMVKDEAEKQRIERKLNAADRKRKKDKSKENE